MSDLFGWSVALDGDTLAVGAHREASNQTSITDRIINQIKMITLMALLVVVLSSVLLYQLG